MHLDLLQLWTLGGGAQEMANPAPGGHAQILGQLPIHCLGSADVTTGTYHLTSALSHHLSQISHINAN